jgi:hypothetical protein
MGQTKRPPKGEKGGLPAWRNDLGRRHILRVSAFFLDYAQKPGLEAFPKARPKLKTTEETFFPTIKGESILRGWGGKRLFHKKNNHKLKVDLRSQKYAKMVYFWSVKSIPLNFNDEIVIQKVYH